jgi:hypothetical protein
MYLSSTVLKEGICDSRSRTRGLTARYAPRTDLKLFACSVSRTHDLIILST